MNSVSPSVLVLPVKIPAHCLTSVASSSSVSRPCSLPTRPPNLKPTKPKPALATYFVCRVLIPDTTVESVIVALQLQIDVACSQIGVYLKFQVIKFGSVINRLLN